MFQRDSCRTDFRCQIVLRQSWNAVVAWNKFNTSPGKPQRHEVLISWTLPPMGHVKLNIDGCSEGNPGQAGAGGLFQNWKGEWMLGFVANLGVATVTQAELRALGWASDGQSMA